MPRVDRNFGAPSAANYTGSGTNYVVSGPTGALYFVFINATPGNVVYVKSTDGGLTWAAPVTVLTGTYVQVSVWYDVWSTQFSAGNTLGFRIHIVGTNSADSDIDYRSLNTLTDTLGTQTVCFAGASVAANPGGLSICVAVGGNILVAYNIDGGTEHGLRRSVDAGVNWTARAAVTEAAAGDYFVMTPGWDGLDTQDMICIFWDLSANELSRKVYDDSANSIAETSIATGMTAGTAATAWPPFAIGAAGYVAAWSATDAANADLRLWFVIVSSISEVSTNVVLNSTDDQGMVALAIDDVLYYVFYCGASAGGETFNTSMNIYYKTSADGITWSGETALTTTASQKNFLFCDPAPLNGRLVVAHSPSATNAYMNVELPTLTPAILVNSDALVS